MFGPSCAALRCVLIVVTLLAAACVHSARSRATVLITIGGLRADAVSVATTPRLQRIVSAGGAPSRLMTASPETTIALAALMTGLEVDQLEAPSADLLRLPAGAITLAERARAAGAATTAYIGDGDISTLTGLARGFDAWSSPSLPSDQVIAAGENERLKPLRGGYLPAAQLGSLASNSVREALSAKRPTFVWVHFGDLEATALAGGSAEQFATALQEIDRAVGLIEDALHTYGGAAAVTLALTSTQGLALGEGGEHQHGLFLSDPVLQVPFGLSGVESSTPIRGTAALGRRLAESWGGPAMPAESISITLATLAQRLYGWGARAAATDARGCLRLDPDTTWTATGAAPLTGPAGWNAAPAELKGRLESRGVHPTSGPTAEAITQSLTAIAAAHQARAQADLPAAIEKLDAASRTFADLPAIWLALATLPPEANKLPGFVARRAQAVQRLAELAGDDPLRRLDLARAAAAAGERTLAKQTIGTLAPSLTQDGGLLALAELQQENGDLDAARELLERVVATNADAPELQEWMGDLLRRQGNCFRARNAYEAALKSARARNGNLLAKLGDCLSELGDKDAALNRYAEALQVEPSFRYPHARAADLLLAKGDGGRAADAILKSLPPNADPVRGALQRAEALATRGLLGPAIIEIDKALHDNSNALDLLVVQGNLLLLARQPEKAGKLAERALAVDPQAPTALVLAARIAAQAGRYDEALAQLTRAEKGASPALAAEVQHDANFRKGGESSPLARRAASFGAQLR